MKKNLTFLAIILFCFAISQFISTHEKTDNKIDMMMIDYIQQAITAVNSIYNQHTILFTLLFSLSFVLLTVFYIPFTGPFYVLFAGALYGFINGSILFSFMVSASYTASFLLTRYLYQKSNSKKRINKKIQHVIDSFEKDGWIYLLSVRFSGVIPALIVNVGMGFTKIPTWQFYIITQMGTLPLVILYSFTGSQIHSLKSLNDFVSPYFLLLIFILSVTPILLKIIFDFIANKTRKKENAPY
ncbi:TVP38/TMEM64 family protein [Silvanigrella aquatica]|uniref:TVP38/TMEM64 family membrane protein n=1 Tax=Silvanigrella aquatica TaxID=1915309 RepID=A0A1L4D334_9BACT|nr:VTT domain-containing protein [Silvanigrella aquatica]APJ04610.1 hypothetical protein AXG55_12120 [Silvanigrella aquatica]